MSYANHLARLRTAPADHSIHKIYFRDNLIKLILEGKNYKTPLFCRVKNSYISQQLNDLIDEIRLAEKQVFHPRQNLEMIFTTPLDVNLTNSTLNVAKFFKGIVDQNFQANSVIYTDRFPTAK